MKRFDLRHLKADFTDRMLEIMDKEVANDEVAIFIFEVDGNFEVVDKTSSLLIDNGYALQNSLKFTQVDWTVVVKKQQQG